MRLEGSVRAFVEARRHAVLATQPAAGGARLVPICFVVDEDGAVVSTPLDEKPKRRSDPRSLARVRDIEARPEVSLLFEHWSEDWSDLAWVRVSGYAGLIEPDVDVHEHRMTVRALRAKYPQYREQSLERLPIIGISVEAVAAWSATGDVHL